MKKSLLNIILLLIIKLGYAQTWSVQTQTNGIQPAYRTSVHFISQNEGWIVGYTGADAILHTTNGGVNWDPQPLPSTYTYSNSVKSVFFTSPTLGWAVGNGNTIIKTTNGGASWTLQPSASPCSWNKVFFYNSMVGWIGGNSSGTLHGFLRTTNGGATWIPVTSFTAGVGFPTGSSPSAVDINFISSTKGWLVNQSGSILTSNDGGVNWTLQYDNHTGIYPKMQTIWFISSNEGWAAGSGTIMKTIDGGNTWTTLVSGTGSTYPKIQFLDSNTGYLAGDAAGGARISSTNDGGITWSANLGINWGVNDLFMFSPTKGWAVGGDIHTLTSIISVAEHSKNNKDVHLFPNPSDNEIKINFDLPNIEESLKITFFSIDGKEIKTLEIDKYIETLVINKEDLGVNNGIFFYKISTPNQIISNGKIIFN